MSHMTFFCSNSYIVECCILARMESEAVIRCNIKFLVISLKKPFSIIIVLPYPLWLCDSAQSASTPALESCTRQHYAPRVSRWSLCYCVFHEYDCISRKDHENLAISSWHFVKSSNLQVFHVVPNDRRVGGSWVTETQHFSENVHHSSIDFNEISFDQQSSLNQNSTSRKSLWLAQVSDPDKR